MAPDSEAGFSWSAPADATSTRESHQDDRASVSEPSNVAATSGGAFVITELPEPLSHDTTAPSTAPGPLGLQTDRDRTGLWDRLGDRRATAVTAAAAGLVLLGVLLVMSMITDGIAFTSDKTEPVGGNTSIVSPPGQDTQPEEPAAPTPPPVTAAPSPSPLPTDPETGNGFPPYDDKDDEDEDDDEDDKDEDDDHEDDDHDDDDEDDEAEEH